MAIFLLVVLLSGSFSGWNAFCSVHEPFCWWGTCWSSCACGLWYHNGAASERFPNLVKGFLLVSLDCSGVYFVLYCIFNCPFTDGLLSVLLTPGSILYKRWRLSCNPHHICVVEMTGNYFSKLFIFLEVSLCHLDLFLLTISLSLSLSLCSPSFSIWHSHTLPSSLSHSYAIPQNARMAHFGARIMNNDFSSRGYKKHAS